MKTAADTRRAVESFWNSRPCDSDRSLSSRGTKVYFEDIERDRYTHQRHILTDVLARIDWK